MDLGQFLIFSIGGGMGFIIGYLLTSDREKNDGKQ